MGTLRRRPGGGRARTKKLGCPCIIIYRERRDSSWCPRVDVGFGFSVVVRLPPPPSCGCPRAVVRRFRPKRGSKIRPERNRAPWSPVAPGALLPYQGLAGPIPEGQGLSSPLPEKGSLPPGFLPGWVLPPYRGVGGRIDGLGVWRAPSKIGFPMYLL